MARRINEWYACIAYDFVPKTLNTFIAAVVACSIRTLIYVSPIMVVGVATANASVTATACSLSWLFRYKFHCKIVCRHVHIYHSLSLFLAWEKKNSFRFAVVFGILLFSFSYCCCYCSVLFFVYSTFSQLLCKCHTRFSRKYITKLDESTALGRIVKRWKNGNEKKRKRQKDALVRRVRIDFLLLLPGMISNEINKFFDAISYSFGVTPVRNIQPSTYIILYYFCLASIWFSPVWARQFVCTWSYALPRYNCVYRHFI